MSSHSAAAEPAPLKKRRRRWVLIAFVLVSLCSWWYWPRGDRRFVGKWERVGGEAKAAELLLTRLELFANGTGHCVGANASETTEFNFPWLVEENTLVLGRSRQGWASMLLDEVDRFTYSWFGYQQLPVEWRFAVRDVSQRELRLENDRSPEDRVFRRSP